MRENGKSLKEMILEFVELDEKIKSQQKSVDALKDELILSLIQENARLRRLLHA